MTWEELVVRCMCSWIVAVIKISSLWLPRKDQKHEATLLQIMNAETNIGFPGRAEEEVVKATLLLKAIKARQSWRQMEVISPI